MALLPSDRTFSKLSAEHLNQSKNRMALVQSLSKNSIDFTTCLLDTITSLFYYLFIEKNKTTRNLNQKKWLDSNPLLTSIIDRSCFQSHATAIAQTTCQTFQPTSSRGPSGPDRLYQPMY
jgi:hypothetical protein